MAGLLFMEYLILELTPLIALFAAYFAVFFSIPLRTSSAAGTVRLLCILPEPCSLICARPWHACCSGSLCLEQKTFPQKRHLKGICSSLPHIQHFLSKRFTVLKYSLLIRFASNKTISREKWKVCHWLSRIIIIDDGNLICLNCLWGLIQKLLKVYFFPICETIKLLSHIIVTNPETFLYRIAV